MSTYFHIVGRDPLILAIPMLLIGVGLMILGFVLLGARTFNLFDPTILSGTIFKRLRQSCKQIQAGGFRWSDPSFQASLPQDCSRVYRHACSCG